MNRKRKRHPNHSYNCQNYKTIQIVDFFGSGENENKQNYLLLLTNPDTPIQSKIQPLISSKYVLIFEKKVKILTLLSLMKNWMIFWGG